MTLTLEPDADTPNRFRVLRGHEPIGFITQTGPDEWTNHGVAKGGSLVAARPEEGKFKTRDLALEAFTKALASDAWSFYCAGCGKPVTVVFQPTDTTGAYQPAAEQPWVCPHGCGHAERPQLKGRIIKVWAVIRVDRLMPETPDCPFCQGERWICEAHPDRPWPHDACPGPGEPCPQCNDGARPELPPDWRSVC